MVRRGWIAQIAVAAGAFLLLSASASASDVVGPPLAAPHVGTPLLAPPPALVDGQAPDFVLQRWERCRHYAGLVTSDRPTTVSHLNFDVADGAMSDILNNGARRFDGIDDSLAAGMDPDVSATRPYTIEIWARPAFGVDGRYRFLVSREATDANGRQGTGIWFSDKGLGFERWSNGVKSGITYSAGIVPGEYTGVTATYDGTTMRLFVDGRLIGSRVTTAPLAAGTDPFEIGAGAGGRSGFFRGDLDELALYDHALTRSHVGAHVFAAKHVPCSQIADADATSYTPTLDDLGDTLKVVTNSTRSYPTGDVTVSSTSESLVPTDDGGQLVHPAILTPAPGATVSGSVQLTAAVFGLPLDRIEFLVDGAVRYAKGEAPYQYTWHTAAAQNGVHSLGVRVWGPGATTPVTTMETVTVAN